jgi:hypothetical protein
MRKFLALLLTFPILALAHGHAGAQVVPPQPAPITDYAGYPGNNELPPGCDANGVIGVTFTVNGGAPVANLQDIDPIHEGDLVVMSWTDVLPVCGDPVNPGPIVLAMKSAPDGTFNPKVDQALDLPYAFGLLVAGQPGSVSYPLPPLDDDTWPGCSGQLDAITGLPLAIVGPDGSYYAHDVPWDHLISSWNGSYPECDAPEVTTTVPTTVPETITTAPEVTTTVPEPTTTTGPALTTTTTIPVALDVTPTEDDVAVAGVVVQQGDSAIAVARAPLPVTGATNPLLTATIAVLALLAGVLMVVAAARKSKNNEDQGVNA